MQIKIFKKRAFVWRIFGIIFTIFLINISFEIYKFYSFKSTSQLPAQGEIIQNYIKNKNNKTYRILKIKTENFYIFTIKKINQNFKIGGIYDFRFETNKIKFLDFLRKSFYARSFEFELVGENEKNSFKDKLITSIKNQHETDLMSEFYSALYLATPISKELRSYVTNWGSAHIVAISGFHISIIFAFIFTFIVPIVRILQDRYFPYRNIYKDINFCVFIMLGYYLILLDFTPSFLRSLMMSFLIYLFLLRNLEIVNFATLGLTFAICVAFSPRICLNLGFYFSCMGVFYIYLYLKHFSNLNFGKFNLFWHWIFLNFWTFFGMNYIVYYFFPTFSYQQIAVIFLSAIFVVFYPLSVFLHLIGQGGIFDTQMINFLKFNLPTANIYPSLWTFALANILAFLGIFGRSIAICGVIFGAFAIFLIE